MIQAIRRRLEPGHEGGFSLIEVIVAMFIFGLIATGVIYTMMQVLVTTRDSRARQVATNLAAQEIDFVRDVEDVFEVLDAPAVGDPPREVSLNSETYTITRTTDWVTNPEGALATCGAGGGTLKYKTVTVSVEWGAGANRRSVESTTLLNPNERLNDPALGTIMVSVADVNGVGLGGVDITAKQAGSPSATTFTATTDAQGCAYLLRLPPETYDVRVASSGYIDVDQNPSPVKTTPVLAGGSVSVGFAISTAGRIDVDFVVDGVDVPVGQLPSNMHVTTVSTYGTIPVENNGGTSLQVYPFPDGYTLIAGDHSDCTAIDPQSWPEDALRHAGERAPTVTVAPGGTETIDLPVRRIQISGFATWSGWGPWGSWSGGDQHRYITAVAAHPEAGCRLDGSGNPVRTTYTFNALGNGDSAATIALPPGVWNVFTGTSAGATSLPLTSARMTVEGTDVISGNTVTFDPRVAK